MPRVALLSTSDTDLLSARSSRADYVLANPSRLDVTNELPAFLAGADLVIVRILGTARSWQDGLDTVRALGVPMVVLGGEQTPDAELMRNSTVPIGVAAQAHQYMAEGGPGNLRQLHAFCSDTVLLTGEGFESPTRLPAWGLLDRRAPDRVAADRPLVRIGILYYRAHQASGNTAFVHALADAVDAIDGFGCRPGAVAVPIFCSSLRGAPDDLLAQLSTLDALIVSVLAAGGTKPATATAGGDDGAWDVTALAALDIPILQRDSA
jgi:cobaltochelatase CobN